MCVTARRYRYLLVASLVSAALAVSLAYHACVVFDVCGGYDKLHWQVWDHITANLMFVAVAFVVASPQDEVAPVDDVRSEDAASPEPRVEYHVRGGALRRGHPTRAAHPPAAYHLRYAHAVLPFLLVACALVVLADPYSVASSFVTISLALWAVAAYFVVFRVERARVRGAPDATMQVNPAFLVLTLVAGGLAVLCFLSEEPGASSLLHSTWHVWAALTVSALILTFETTLECSDLARYQHAAARSRVHHHG